MELNPDRRAFLRASTALAAGALFSKPMFAQQPTAAPTAANPANKPPPKPAALDPEKVQATVGQAHRSLENVMKLVD